MTSGEWVGQNHPWLRTTLELESESDFWDPFMLSEQVMHVKRKSKTKPQVLTQSFLSSDSVSLNRQVTKNQTSVRSSPACRELTVRSVGGQMCKQLWTIGLIGRRLVILLGVTQPNPTDHTFHLSDSFSGVLHSQSLFKSWVLQKHLLLILLPWSLALVAPAWKVLSSDFHISEFSLPFTGQPVSSRKPFWKLASASIHQTPPMKLTIPSAWLVA